MTFAVSINASSTLVDDFAEHSQNSIPFSVANSYPNSYDTSRLDNLTSKYIQYLFSKSLLLPIKIKDIVSFPFSLTSSNQFEIC